MKGIYSWVPIALILLAGCKVGPNYKRPQIDTPLRVPWRGSTSCNAEPKVIGRRKMVDGLPGPGVTTTDPHRIG